MFRFGTPTGWQGSRRWRASCRTNDRESPAALPSATHGKHRSGSATTNHISFKPTTEIHYFILWQRQYFGNKKNFAFYDKTRL